MKSLTSQRALISAYNKGNITQVAIDLNRYFDIESDKEWNVTEGSEFVQGYYRKRSYLVQSKSKGQSIQSRWTTVWHNGQVKSVSCEFEA